MALPVMPGLSAAIVVNAVGKINDMMNTADARMRAAVGTYVNGTLAGISPTPDALGASYPDEYASARNALSGAELGDVTAPAIDTLPLFLGNVVGSFYGDYMANLDTLFPGLSAAGAVADAYAQAALSSAIGMSYNEAVDQVPIETAWRLAQREAFAAEREAYDGAARAGHRFAPGTVFDAMARLHGGSIAGAAGAAVERHAGRLQQERSEKMRLISAMLDTNMDRVKRIHQQVAEAFKLKLRARGLWVDDQNAVIDASGNTFVLNERFQNTLTGLMRKTATRRFNLDFDKRLAGDRTEVLAKLRMGLANEVVDLFGNAVTTLMNQINARGVYRGSETDVTDWDSILA